MTDHEADQSDVTIEELERTRKQHARELRQLEKMTDEQFVAFKRNFDLGKLDPTLTRREAIDILRSMICTNLSLQQEKKGEQTVESSAGRCYPDDEPERE